MGKPGLRSVISARGGGPHQEGFMNASLTSIKVERIYGYYEEPTSRYKKTTKLDRPTTTI